MKKFRELKEEVSTPPIGVRSLYTKMYAKHGGTVYKAKDAQSKAYAEVEKKHGKEMRNSLEAYHKKNMNEENDTVEKNEMASTQAHFIKYAAEEILEYIEMGGEIEEWYQNKLSKVHSDMEGLHSWMEGEKRRTDMVKEEVEQLDEKNKPTNPELWSRAVSMAKQKFDVYPSAYANGWAAKWYKEKGGGWRSVNEENYEVTVMHTTKDGAKGEHTHNIKNADNARHAKNIALQKHEKMLKSKGQEVRGMGTTNAKMVEAKENDLPFTPDAPKKKSVVVGKKPEGYSIARQLARQAMQKQIDKLKKPMKEAEERGTEPFLKTSRKAEIVKSAAKNSKDSIKFQSEPELSSTVTRNN